MKVMLTVDDGGSVEPITLKTGEGQKAKGRGVAQILDYGVFPTYTQLQRLLYIKSAVAVLFLALSFTYPVVQVQGFMTMWFPHAP